MHLVGISYIDVTLLTFSAHYKMHNVNKCFYLYISIILVRLHKDGRLHLNILISF